MKAHRPWAVALTIALSTACDSGATTEPIVEDETPTPFDPGDPPPESGLAFHLMFDGVDDRVEVPWHASFPSEVFTVVARIRLTPPSRRAAIVARGEDDNSFNLSWQLYVSGEGSFEVMLEASNEDNYCYPNNDCVPKGSCESDDLFVADGAWHQVALTRDSAGTLVFYVDGAEQARCSGTGVPSSNNEQVLSFGATFGSIGPLPPGGTEPRSGSFRVRSTVPRCGRGRCHSPRSSRSSRWASTSLRQSCAVTGPSTKAMDKRSSTGHPWATMGIWATIPRATRRIRPGSGSGRAANGRPLGMPPLRNG